MAKLGRWWLSQVGSAPACLLWVWIQTSLKNKNSFLAADSAAVDGPSATDFPKVLGVPAIAGVSVGVGIRALLTLCCCWLLATAKAGLPGTTGILGKAGTPAIAETALGVVLKHSPSFRCSHRLNMELNLQSLFGLHVTWCAQLFSLAETPQPPSPPPAFGLKYDGRYWSAKIDDLSL